MMKRATLTNSSTTSEIEKTSWAVPRAVVSRYPTPPNVSTVQYRPSMRSARGMMSVYPMVP